MALNSETTGLSNPTLLEKIDKLRDFNIGQHVPLPQLVVVGDQSSGKSSLLETLTGVPFPKDHSLCTRHATQITSRRDANETVDIRIIAGPQASEEHKRFVEGFHMHLSSVLEFRMQFADILKKANERMGLRADLSADEGAVFSEDILKIVMKGPKEDYLTIIDVPGIFRTTTVGTTKDDMNKVKNMVKRYIENERTVILAVLPSNVDVATQEILELAEEYDKTGQRTLGVLTKPDLVTTEDHKAAVCDLVLGEKRPLKLGYFVVRNRTAKGENLENLETDTFGKHPWIKLPSERVGIQALKDQLGPLLIGITRREFPALIKDVNRQTADCKRELDSLGPPRQEEREQRSFLCRIASKFQDLARAALAADYNANTAFNQQDLRLITHIVNITDVFSAHFELDGHTRPFQYPGPNPLGAEGPVDSQSQLADRLMPDDLQELVRDANVDDLTTEEIAELGDIIVPFKPSPIPTVDITRWINNTFTGCRGLDLGTFNSNLVAMAFTEQSSKWGHMTEVYMSRVILVLHRFISGAIRSVCIDEQSRHELWSAILEGLLEKYKMAKSQAKLLVEIERRKQPYTLNKQFNESLSRARGHRMTELLRPRARKDTKQYGSSQDMVNLSDIAEAARGKSNAEQLQEEIHDILHAYYSLALDRFVDNVFQLAVDYHLLSGPHSPLKVFTQDWVIDLEPKQLERIAGETKIAKKRRSKLSKKIEDLNNALRILKA
ncbi:hypothetical protein HJFPF1_02212 [Paramyrothecium foliicola]|nr:hypothetical protein HJFPF1_02212 [Paramyrothecium foliicola]